MTPTPGADVLSGSIVKGGAKEEEKPNHGTDQRQMVDVQCLPAPSTAFLEIEDSIAGSFREICFPHPSLPPYVPEFLL